METKAFAYIRVSSKGQEAGDGFTRQLSTIKAYAKANGFKIAKIYREVEKGATESLEREAWSQMITDLHSNGTRTVIVEKLDRLARAVVVQEQAISYMQRNSFQLLSVCEPDLMSDDPYRVAMRQMMGVFAQLDKAQIVLKLRGARQRKRAAEGRCEGRKPFGHFEGEQTAISRMQDLRAEGLSYARIASTLNAEGVPTRTGKPWVPFTVDGILSRNVKE